MMGGIINEFEFYCSIIWIADGWGICEFLKIGVFIAIFWAILMSCLKKLCFWEIMLKCGGLFCLICHEYKEISHEPSD